jgi:hypothetical protein
MRVPLLQTEIGDDKNGKNDAGDAIGGHKGEIDPAEVIRPDYGMLVHQHPYKDGYPAPVPPAKTAVKPCADHAGYAKNMQKFRDMEGISLSQPGRHGIQLLGFVELFILQGINNIEAADPENDSKGEQNWQQRKMTRDGQISADRRQRETQAQHQVA